MDVSLFLIKRKRKSRVFTCMVLFVFGWVVSHTSYAHPSPNSLIFLDVSANHVRMELQIPIPELALVFGEEIQKSPEQISLRYANRLRAYLLKHIQAYSQEDRAWEIDIENMRMDKGAYVGNNILYWELIAEIVLIPRSGESTRQFTLKYDAIIHQVMNHVAVVSIRSDWEGGIIHADSTMAVSVIGWDLGTNTIHPLEVNLAGGSWYNGSRTMFIHGMRHIKEGTDHLLFLLTLLLPAPLRPEKQSWGNYGGLRYSFVNLLRIITAFSIGHSITLLIGALEWVSLPAEPIEILIAFSILVSAAHAFRPVFPGKELYVATGFGLIHGLAFADTLSNLNLDTTQMALSILGFNLGIEVMQLAIIIVVIPWFVLLSRFPVYTGIRIGGSLIAAVAATGWMVERVTGTGNYVTRFVEQMTSELMKFAA